MIDKLYTPELEKKSSIQEYLEDVQVDGVMVNVRGASHSGRLNDGLQDALEVVENSPKLRLAKRGDSIVVVHDEIYKKHQNINMGRDTLQLQTSTPIPITGVTFEQRNGEEVAVIRVNNRINIILMKDAVDNSIPAGRAMTRILRNIGGADISTVQTRNGRHRIISISYDIYFRTLYSSLAVRDSNSNYGRGTTTEDRSGGNTTVRFHEGQHGTSIINYIRRDRFRRFTRSILNRRFENLEELQRILGQEYQNQINTILRASELQVDCTGSYPAPHFRIQCPPQHTSEPTRQRRNRIE